MGRAVAIGGLTLVIFGSANAVQAQDQPHTHDMQMDMPANGWQFMHDGLVNGIFNHQGGPRGGDEGKATNWWMSTATRAVGRQRLTLTGMFSLDPATAADDGYREIFQVGETFEGKPLIDHQHPHDLFMQLAAAWKVPVSDSTSLVIAGGPSGEPALGPAAFMHRASMAAILFAPLSHHTFDSTHISFGVATVGVEHAKWTVEASAFNGREPDEHRWDFDFGKMDSMSGRVWFRPGAAWEIQISSGRLVEPEQLEPGTVVRTTGSGSWLTTTDTGFRAATFGYGVNRSDQGHRQAAFAEFTRSVRANTFSSRLEIVQVETATLLNGELETFNLVRPGFETVTGLTLGALREIVSWRHVESSVGANVTFHRVPDTLRQTHGEHPVSFQVFLQVRPRIGGMARMWNMRMGG